MAVWSHVLLFLAAFAFFGLFAHGYIENTDAEMTMHAARAFYLRGDFGLVADAPDSSAAETWIAVNRQSGMTGQNGKHYLWFPIGHQMLMVPCVALGELFSAWFPAPAAAYAEIKTPLFGGFYWTRFFVSWIPVLAAAGSTVMVLLIVRATGCGPREGLLVTAVTVLCTQFWPAASETMSDGPGLFFLLAMVAGVLRYQAGVGGALTLGVVGFAGGAAVLVRYPNAIGVAILAVVVCYAAWRRRRLSDVLVMGLAAAPGVVALLLANLWRFGSLTETGYSAGANADWWSFPAYFGIPCILLAPGKGLLWFSPPVWIAVTQLFRRDLLRSVAMPMLLIALTPIVVYGHAAAWGAGQCWGIRYVTPSVVLLVAVGLALGKPWRRRPRLFAAVCAVGFVVSLGGVLTPYRGQVMLATAAARLEYPDAGAAIPNNVNFAPRFSPLHTHWIYAWLSATGRLQRGGPANTTQPMFGLHADPLPPLPAEDVGFRHWWMVLFTRSLGVDLRWLAVAWVLVTLGLLGAAVRALWRSPQPS